MTRLTTVNLIHLYDFYLAAMFVVGTWRRLEQYRHTFSLVFAFPGRWPNLLKLARSHRTIFLTWKTLLPSVLTLVVWLAHTFASRLIWHHARLTGSDLLDHWGAMLIVVPLGTAMLTLDTYYLIRVGVIDRAMLDQYFDQAEHWLTSWQAPAVRILTLGYVNPRRMVGDEVRKALLSASDLLNRNLYLTALQMALRVAFGLGLWLTWAVFVDPTP